MHGLDWVIAGAGIVVSYVLGAIYNLYGLRAVFNGNSHARIITNIKHRLLEIGRTTPLTDERKNQLERGSELMDVFYSLVDSNDTLKERAKLVRDNGLIWSTVADVTMLSTMFGALYLPLWLTTGEAQFMIWGLGAAVVALVAGLSWHPRAERRHVQLGNDQLNFIAQHLKNEASEKVNAL